MTWIDQRLADLEAWKRRNDAIRQQAPKIYKDLWAAIVTHVEDARDKGLTVSTLRKNDRVGGTVLIDYSYKSAVSLELSLSIGESKSVIWSIWSWRSGEKVDFGLTLDLDPCGVMCLTSGVEQFSVEDAAIWILDPFLFPELQSEAARDEMLKRVRR